jgi:hypothetical protein
MIPIDALRPYIEQQSGESHRYRKLAQAIATVLVGVTLLLPKDAHAQVMPVNTAEPKGSQTTPAQINEEDEQPLEQEVAYYAALKQAVADVYAATQSSTTEVKNPTNEDIHKTLGELLSATTHAEDTQRIIAAFVDQLMVNGNIDNYRTRLDKPETSAEEKAAIKQAIASNTLAKYILEHEISNFSPELVVRIAQLVEEIRAGLEKTAAGYNAKLTPVTEWKAFDPENPLDHPQVVQTPVRLTMSVLLEQLERGENELTPGQIKTLLALLTMPATDYWSFLRDNGSGPQMATNGILAALNNRLHGFQFKRDGANWAGQLNELYGWDQMETQHGQSISEKPVGN